MPRVSRGQFPLLEGATNLLLSFATLFPRIVLQGRSTSRMAALTGLTRFMAYFATLTAVPAALADCAGTSQVRALCGRVFQGDLPSSVKILSARKAFQFFFWPKIFL